MRIIAVQHFAALNRMPDTLDKEKIGDSKKREQREEQSQSRYLHTEARGALKGRVEPSRASKGPFYACGRKGSVKLSYRAVYFFISRLDPVARARGRSFSTRKGWFLRPTDFPIAVLWRVNTPLHAPACERAANKKKTAHAIVTLNRRDQEQLSAVREKEGMQSEKGREKER